MTLNLSESQTWTADVGRDGIEVQVRSGEVWLTRQNDPEDHVLRASEIFDSSWKGRLVLCALTPARIEVTELPAAAASEMAHAA
jgi:hypothetical protein